MFSLSMTRRSTADLVGELLSQNPGAEIQYAVSGADVVENTPVSDLAANRPCLQIDYAENGREALAKLARSRRTWSSPIC